MVAFKLSDIGEGIGEVTLKEWYVKVGDKVRQFDSICEVQSDKASVTITSRYDGVIRKIHYKIDDIAKVGQPLVDIQLDSDNTRKLFPRPLRLESTFDSPTEHSEQLVDESDKTSDNFASEADGDRSFQTSEKVLTTPAVRRLAIEHSIRLQEVVGSGKDGRILKEDVLNFIANKTKQNLMDKIPVINEEVPNKSLSIEGREKMPEVIEKPKTQPKTSVDRSEPIKGIRKAMTKTMTQALSIPHFGLSDEIDVSNLVQLRATLKQLAKDRSVSLTYMPFFVKAVSMALLEFPIINSTVDQKCENITYKASHNIGVAMDTKEGLVVPNVKNVQNLSVIDIARELNRLQESGARNQLSAIDLSDGTLTLSNIGSVCLTRVRPQQLKRLVFFIDRRRFWYSSNPSS